MELIDWLGAYWPLALIATLFALALLYFLLRPRQRVSLSNDIPVRPHMVHSKTGDARDHGEGPASIVDTGFPIISTPAQDALPGEEGSADDLLRLKGIGPKLAALLHARGIMRFEQLAKLTPEQVDDLDRDLGAFRGRLARDHVIDQAGYLARGDTDGFEQRFGKL